MALTDKLTNIGNAIREKTGKSELIPLDNMPDEIRSISGGGGGDTNPTADPKDINFYDYEGTLRYSYTLAEAKALESLPPGPTHEGLTFQEWNWSLEDIKALEYSMNIGATYITDDGKTRLYITVPANAMPDKPPPRNQVPLYIQQTVDNGVTIDWGDGSPTETLPGTGKVNTTHTYEKAGNFVITLDPNEGCKLGFGTDSSSYCVMGKTSDYGIAYCNMLNKVEIGLNVTSISSYSFYNCYSLAQVSISNNVQNIKSNGFSSCRSLVHLSTPNSVNDSPDFIGCWTFTSVSIPNNVTTISSSKFRDCYSLISISIPNKVTSIGTRAFLNCFSIASISIPDSVQSINDESFSSCIGMKDIYLFPNIPPSIQSITFRSISSDCIFHVRPESLEAYKAATNWSALADQIVGDLVV